MVSNEEVALPQGMKIARLCKESGLTRSTIHHYLNIGLLHRPRQAGLNLRLFDETHLNRLRQIRWLRENERLPLAQIKELLDRVEPRECCAVDAGKWGRTRTERLIPRTKRVKGVREIKDARTER